MPHFSISLILLTFIVCAQSQYWLTGNLSLARTLLTSASLDATGLVMFAGGAINAAAPYTPSAVVDIFDKNTGTWTAGALSAPRYALAGATVVGTLGQSALFAGGTDPTNNPSAVVDVYEDWSAQWKTMNLSSGRTSLTACSLGFQAFFAGGQDNSNRPSTVVDVYNSKLHEWKAMGLSIGRMNLASTSIESGSNSLVFFAGGLDPTGEPSVAIDIYDANANTWSTAALSTARTNLAATSCGNLVMFGGGMTTASGSFSNVVDVYNVDTKQWSTSALSLARAYLTGVQSMHGECVFAGGEYENDFFEDETSTAMDVFSVSSQSWTAVTLPNARLSHTVARDAQKNLYFAGGLYYATLSAYTLASVDVYSEIVPTAAPSRAPTHEPTAHPTPKPSPAPTDKPSPAPTPAPTAPTHRPTPAPTGAPTLPTAHPTPAPTHRPTPSPTGVPTSPLTHAPTPQPTHEPTLEPTATPKPSAATPAPTDAPTDETKMPTSVPTAEPSHAPTEKPTEAPTVNPDLTGGEIAGITIAVLVVVLGIGAILGWYFNWCCKKNTYSYSYIQ